ncbi:hypothetical protein BRARA_C03463 [Brassica rapa]|uniref:WPP domain-containing protein n=1 Tax=Brassica campestris TaxID=3711 RepID=A0A398A7A7_BRACM|nr:hypothetical protein BRARA_C03463 [Brassica rapa]
MTIDAPNSLASSVNSQREAFFVQSGMNHSVPESVEGVGSPQRSNSVDSLKAETPTRKGFGLKKWRRIKRDGPVKDEATTTPADDEGSKLLKRGLTGLVNPPLKHVDLSSVEARQSSEGSVGSVNMAVHHHHLIQGVANGFSTDPGVMFSVGFEKSEEGSDNSVAAKNVVGGKVVSGSQGKIWRDTIKNASQKPCSSVESDLRSSDFVFSSGAVSAANNHGGNDERKEVQTYSRSQNGEQDEDGDGECKEENHYWADKDQIADSIRNLAALHDALWKELKSFQELGKESLPLPSDKPKNENCREEKSSSSESQVLILKQKVKHLQHKLEEARADLNEKEARIQELEYSKIEAELEGVFRRRMEAEIKHLVLTRSLSSSLQVLEEQQPSKVHSLTEDPEPNRGNLLGKTCKSSFYFLIQLILLVFILRLLVLQCSPASRLVIPPT